MVREANISIWKGQRCIRMGGTGTPLELWFYSDIERYFETQHTRIIKANNNNKYWFVYIASEEIGAFLLVFMTVRGLACKSGISWSHLFIPMGPNWKWHDLQMISCKATSQHYHKFNQYLCLAQIMWYEFQDNEVLKKSSF